MLTSGGEPQNGDACLMSAFLLRRDRLGSSLPPAIAAPNEIGSEHFIAIAVCRGHALLGRYGRGHAEPALAATRCPLFVGRLGRRRALLPLADDDFSEPILVRHVRRPVLG